MTVCVCVFVHISQVPSISNHHMHFESKRHLEPDVANGPAQFLFTTWHAGVLGDTTMHSTILGRLMMKIAG